jgi:hypothetical protein
LKLPGVSHMFGAAKGVRSGGEYQWGSGCTAVREAAALFEMVRRGKASLDSVRELISVPSDIEGILRLYATQNPSEASGVARMLRFRESVSKEFEQLVSAAHLPAASAPVALGQVLAA